MKLIKLICDDKIFRIDQEKLDSIINLESVSSSKHCNKIDNETYIFDVDSSAIQYIVDTARGYETEDVHNKNKTLQALNQLGVTMNIMNGGGNNIFQSKNINLDDPKIVQAIEEYNNKLNEDSDTISEHTTNNLSEELKSMKQQGGSTIDNQITEIFNQLNIQNTGNLIEDLNNPAVENAILEFNKKLEEYSDFTATEGILKPMTEEKVINDNKKELVSETSDFNTELYSENISLSKNFEKDNMYSETSEFHSEYRNL